MYNYIPGIHFVCVCVVNASVATGGATGGRNGPAKFGGIAGHKGRGHACPVGCNVKQRTTSRQPDRAGKARGPCSHVFFLAVVVVVVVLVLMLVLVVCPIFHSKNDPTLRDLRQFVPKNVYAVVTP